MPPIFGLLMNLKKSLVLSLLGFATPFFSFASIENLDSLSNQKEIEIFTHNDNFGAGYTPIYDNLRSYGLGINIKANDSLSMSLNLSGLTNNSYENISDRGRLDELFFKIHFKINKSQKNQIFINTGIASYNNWGMGFAQDLTHNIFGVKSDNLNYTYENEINALMGIKLIHSFKPIHQNIWIQPQIEYNYFTNNYHEITPKIPISLNIKNQKIFNFSLGYRHISNLSNQKIIENINRAESGLLLEYKMIMGPIAFSWVAYPNQNFSIGTYSLILKKQTQKYEKPDVILELGAFAESGGFYNKISWNKTGFLTDHLLFNIYKQYSTYLRKKLNGYPDRYSNQQQYGIGFDLHAFKSSKKFQVNPYIGFNMGIKRAMVYSGRKYYAYEEFINPAMIGEAGLKIKLPDSWSYQNTLFALGIHYKYAKIFSNDNYESHYLKSNPHYFGAGLIAFLDI